MTDLPVQTVLVRLLQRAQRVRLANHLIAFALFAAGLYLALLIAVLAFALSLFLFHLVFYSGLSLLPLFLTLGSEHEQTLTVLRRIDEHCQAEAYLSTASPAHRAFLEPRVRSLLARRARERILRFRLHAWNRFLAIGVAGLFVAFQLLALATLRGPPNLSASGILARKARQEAIAQGNAKSLESPDSDEAAAEGTAAAALGEKRSEPDSGMGPAEDTAGPFADTGPLVNPSVGEAAGPGTAGERTPWAAIPKSEAGIGPALRGALEGSPDPSVQQGQVPAGVGEAGRAFLASPLSDYESVAQRIQTEGGKRLTASSPAEPRAQPFLQALFADFPALPSLAPGFDPAMERIQHRYLELLDERF